MSVTLWNAIITVGISVTSLMIASATCTLILLYTVHVRARVIKPRAYGVHVLGMERRKELARLRKQRQRMAEKHAVSRPGYISKHQELVRQVKEGQSTMIIDALHKALSIWIPASFLKMRTVGALL